MIFKQTINKLFIFSLFFLVNDYFIYGSKKINDDKKNQLPFSIASEKMMSDEDLVNKKEGFYFTGLPQISSDPLNGFGYGAEASLFFNGNKEDPFFRYTPYQHRLDVVLFNTTNSQIETALNYDAPYILGSKWRMRASAVYEKNPNLVYFGKDESSLRKLTYTGLNSSSPVTKNSFDDYSKYLESIGQRQYNSYQKEEALLNISFEHSFLQSKLRILAGYELAGINISTFSGRSLLQADVSLGKVVGVNRSLITIWQLGIVYDTRNLESDPSKGIFAEFTDEYSSQGLGSTFSFNKMFGQIKAYYPILPSILKKFTFVTRLGMGYTAGFAPFYEYQDQWGSEGSIEGLGGGSTLKGYKQSRFLGKVMNFANFEVRFRVSELDILKQHFAFSIVPSFDLGGVWDNLNRLSHFENYRYSAGFGLRIAWNLTTIITLDYAYSREDQQFFLKFSQ